MRALDIPTHRKMRRGTLNDGALVRHEQEEVAFTSTCQARKWNDWAAAFQPSRFY